MDRLRIVPADTAGLAFSVQAVTLNKGYGFSPVWFGLVLAFWAVLLANDAHCRRKARPKGGRLVRLPSESDTRPRRA